MSRKSYISIEFDKRDLKKIKQLEKKLPAAVIQGISDGSEQIANTLRVAASAFQWRGTLMNSINVTSPAEGEFDIKMWAYGRDLNDSPSTAHWVSLKKGRKITKWAMEHGFLSSQKSLYVLGGSRPYQGWIDNALVNAPSTVQQHVQSQLGAIK